MPKKPRHPISRAEVSEICKRLVKPETFSAKREIILFYRIFDLFPNPAFWRVYDPGFLLNSIAFFISEAGQEKVKTDLAVFLLDLEPHQSYDLGTKVGEDYKPTKKINKTSDLFLSPAQALGQFNPLDHEQTK